MYAQSSPSQNRNKALFMYTWTLDCSFSHLSSKHLSSVHSLIILDDKKKQRRHNPCPKDPSRVDLGRKLVMLQSCEWMQFMWCLYVCCLNVPNEEGRFEQGPEW